MRLSVYLFAKLSEIVQTTPFGRDFSKLIAFSPLRFVIVLRTLVVREKVQEFERLFLRLILLVPKLEHEFRLRDVALVKHSFEDANLLCRATVRPYVNAAV